MMNAGSVGVGCVMNAGSVMSFESQTKEDSVIGGVIIDRIEKILDMIKVM